MPQGYLVVQEQGGPERRVPVGSTLLIGRTVDCGLVIEDPAASRQHVLVTEARGEYSWRDLGSTNGTLHNGVRALDGALKPGDALQIGTARLRFELEDAHDEIPAGEASTLFKQTIINTKGHVEEPKPSRAHELFSAVYSVTNAIASNFEPCSLVDTILETTTRAIHAQRGVVFFAGHAIEDLAPCPVCEQVHVIENGLLRHGAPEEFPLSKTVVRRVLSEGESVLFKDTGADDELTSADSIVALNLRSIICAPLRGKFGILGILYIDSTRPEHTYSHDDMLLATAVANSAGLAIENASMHHQLLDKQRIEQEIEHAWTIQEGFLVRDWPLDDGRFDVYGETRPAKTVGGDFYDFVRPDPNHVGLLIGDVSGKGVPAALTMAQLLAEFRLHARSAAPPAAVLEALNAGLVTRSQHGAFCTLCYLTLDLRTGEVQCANAGHLPPLRADGESHTLFGHASGIPLGILPTAGWRDETLRLQPGDTVLLYTDGVVEARNATAITKPAQQEAPEEYGLERLCAVVHEQRRCSVHGLVQAVNEGVSRYCAPAAPHDDRTLIALRYTG